ncbi:hypothetical protein BD779DRAFT_1530729 [Infundibulicybe gibba]|nr:hypothetical protein BD779DRAFT_1530729 [Infundibulicybe gibba]
MALPLILVRISYMLDILHNHIQWALYLTFSLTSATDILIAATLVFTLSRSGINLSWTNSSYMMLFAYLLNTGILVSFFSAAGVIAYAAAPISFIFLSIEVVLTKQTRLNARYYLQPKKYVANVAFKERESTYSLSDTESSSQDQESRFPAALTINEVGLPLFKREPSKPEVDRAKMVEVVVRKEELSIKD